MSFTKIRVLALAVMFFIISFRPLFFLITTETEATIYKSDHTSYDREITKTRPNGTTQHTGRYETIYTWQLLYNYRHKGKEISGKKRVSSTSGSPYLPTFVGGSFTIRYFAPFPYIKTVVYPHDPWETSFLYLFFLPIVAILLSFLWPLWQAWEQKQACKPQQRDYWDDVRGAFPQKERARKVSPKKVKSEYNANPYSKSRAAPKPDKKRKRKSSKTGKRK